MQIPSALAFTPVPATPHTTYYIVVFCAPARWFRLTPPTTATPPTMPAENQNSAMGVLNRGPGPGGSLFPAYGLVTGLTAGQTCTAQFWRFYRRR